MDLDQINRERQKRKKRPLTQQEAERATASRPPGDDMNLFLLGYVASSDDTYTRTEAHSEPTHHHSGGTDGSQGGYSPDTGGGSSDTGGGGGGDP